MLTTWHPLSTKVGTNFADKRRSLGWYNSFVTTEVFFYKRIQPLSKQLRAGRFLYLVLVSCILRIETSVAGNDMAGLVLRKAKTSRLPKECHKIYFQIPTTGEQR
jgi:hypothetical protein